MEGMELFSSSKFNAVRKYAERRTQNTKKKEKLRHSNTQLLNNNK